MHFKETTGKKKGKLCLDWFPKLCYSKYCNRVVQSLKVMSNSCNCVDCSTPAFPVLHYLLEFAQTHIHWVDDAIQPSHTLSPPFSSCPQSLLNTMVENNGRWNGFSFLDEVRTFEMTKWYIAGGPDQVCQGLPGVAWHRSNRTRPTGITASCKEHRALRHPRDFLLVQQQHTLMRPGSIWKKPREGKEKILKGDQGVPQQWPMSADKG